MNNDYINLMLEFKDFDFSNIPPEEGCALFQLSGDDATEIFSDRFTIISAYWAIDDFKKKFFLGDDLSLMWALNIVANNHLLMPTWLSKELNLRISAVQKYEYKDWDDVFGSPVPKGKSLYNLRNDKILLFKIGNTIISSIKAGKSVNTELFEEVAEKYHTNRDKVAKLYKEFRLITGLGQKK